MGAFKRYTPESDAPCADGVGTSRTTEICGSALAASTPNQAR